MGKAGVKSEAVSDRHYLGDAVYVAIEHGMVKLTTEDGRTATNTIYLEVDVMDALEAWWTRMQEKYKTRGWE
jgi:hypothetical protein